LPRSESRRVLGDVCLPYFSATPTRPALQLAGRRRTISWMQCPVLHDLRQDIAIGQAREKRQD
jgi:hypothetical protein